MSINITVDNAAVLTALAKLQSVASGQGLESAFKSIGEALVSNIQLGFRDQSDPWGNKWQPLSSTTRIVRAKKHGGGVGGNMQILRDTGVMMNSINSQLVSGGVSVGVGDVFGKAAMHQFGGTTTGGRWAGRKIPARPFMPIRGNRVDLPNDWQEDILAIIARNIQNATR